MITKPRPDLLTSSLAVVRNGQTPTGAFLAADTFSQYKYCWFRDGSFIAQSLDLWGDHDRSRRYYDWGANIVIANRELIAEVLSGPAHTTPRAHLHTRYRSDGAMAEDGDWPTFQLDGFGTFLWGIVQHLEMSGGKIGTHWEEAIDLLVRYLEHLWQAPSFDCWEEFPDDVHTSTLAAIYGGAAAVGQRFGLTSATELAESVRGFAVDKATHLGYLPKCVGSDAVDSSLLWTVTFEMLKPDDPIMVATAERIESDLRGVSGGVHRYSRDTYYGGGEWILLTALLGEYWLCRGEEAPGLAAMSWIENQVTDEGHLPEQVPLDLNSPDKYQPWFERWGPIACPLLWSHAAYLRLAHALARRLPLASDGVAS